MFDVSIMFESHLQSWGTTCIDKGLGTVILFPYLKYMFLGSLILYILCLLIKMNNFRDDLTDISANIKSLAREYRCTGMSQ